MGLGSELQPAAGNGKKVQKEWRKEARNAGSQFLVQYQLLLAYFAERIGVGWRGGKADGIKTTSH